MAKITGLKERQLALTSIESKLRSLETLNLFLLTDNPTGEYVIKFDKIKATISCDDKIKVNALVEAYKQTIAKDIHELAEKHLIELDQEDTKIINELYVPDRKSVKTPR